MEEREGAAYGIYRWGGEDVGGGGREGAFLRPDVGGKLKISPAAWRGSRAADTHCSVRELAADPVSAHSRPIMLPVMCVPPPTHPLLPLHPCLCPLQLRQPQRESCQKSQDQTSNQTPGCHTPR